MTKQSEVADIVRALVKGVITQRHAISKLEKLCLLRQETINSLTQNGIKHGENFERMRRERESNEA